MTIEFTGRRTEVPEVVRLLAERKLQKLGKVLRGITRIHVVLSVDKHRQGVEVTVHSRHLDLTATEQSSDFSSALASVVSKLNRQAQRHTGKLQERKRRSLRDKTTSNGESASPVPREEGVPRVIRKPPLRGQAP